MYSVKKNKVMGEDQYNLFVNTVHDIGIDKIQVAVKEGSDFEKVIAMKFSNILSNMDTLLQHEHSFDKNKTKYCVAVGNILFICEYK